MVLVIFIGWEGLVPFGAHEPSAEPEKPADAIEGGNAS